MVEKEKEKHTAAIKDMAPTPIPLETILSSFGKMFSEVLKKVSIYIQMMNLKTYTDKRRQEKKKCGKNIKIGKKTKRRKHNGFLKME